MFCLFKYHHPVKWTLLSPFRKLRRWSTDSSKASFTKVCLCDLAGPERVLLFPPSPSLLKCGAQTSCIGISWKICLQCRFPGPWGWGPGFCICKSLYVLLMYLEVWEPLGRAVMTSFWWWRDEPCQKRPQCLWGQVIHEKPCLTCSGHTSSAPLLASSYSSTSVASCYLCWT